MNIELTDHCNEVSEIAVDIAREMELCPFYINQIGLAAQYHDIGKDYIPQSILDKPDKLTREEQMIMRTHTSIGFWVLQNSKNSFCNIAAEVALNHHENYDGTGYYGKQNEDISLASRIIHVADVFSALITDRAYRPARKLEEGVLYITRNSGKLFDPLVVYSFHRIIDRYTDIMLNKANKIKEACRWN